MMTFSEFMETDIFKMADVVTTVDGSGTEVDGDWCLPNSPVLEYHQDGGYLEIVVGREG